MSAAVRPWMGHYLGPHLLPVLVANAIGGVTLVARLNYGQVVAVGESESALRRPAAGAPASTLTIMRPAP